MTVKSDIWKELQRFGTCMITTRDGRSMHSRPMAPHFEEDENRIRFLTEAGSPKTEEIADDSAVNLAFADERSMTFVSVSGRATVSHDRRLIRELWNSYADAWFEGDAETANVAVITVKPAEAQIWNGTGSRLLQFLEVAKARVAGGRPDMGENAKVGMR